MFFLALATDYDGTIATDSVVPESTVDALLKVKKSGRKLLLVTGRELPDLQRVFRAVDIFDLVVAENGAVLYAPATREETVLGPSPDPQFVAALERRGVTPISVGRSIVATWEPHQTAVLETIKEFGLELDIVFNKGAVMVLPGGITKASGLESALAKLQLSAINVVGIGDAENDHAFLRACGCSIAVANALDAVKQTADLVTQDARGAGVEQLVEELLARDDALGVSPRNRIVIGADSENRSIQLWPRDVVLIAGSSGFGKSTLATALSERLIEKGFQFVVFDPEGDYQELEGAVSVGDARNPPGAEQALGLLATPQNNAVVNTLALELKDRPDFFARFYPELTRLRSKTGRPHWIIIDEAHHLMPAARDSTSLSLSDDPAGTMMITVHPEAVSPDALGQVTAVVAIGPEAPKVIASLCAATGRGEPAGVSAPEKERALFWRIGEDSATLFTPVTPKQKHHRHTRKYAEGKLDAEKSFYFRGPGEALNLRAHNLLIFLQMAEGVDDATWLHHLHAGDYSRWFRDTIRDDGLAEAAAAVEADDGLSPSQSRDSIGELIKDRYTAPAALESAV
jgi:HAD superfamily hydrolase (TIGR01484 family)